MRIHRYVVFLALAGCTQAPAQIDLRGQNSYVRTAAQGYAAAAPDAAVAAAPARMETGAAVSSIGISELTPLSGSSAPGGAAPFKPAMPAGKASLSGQEAMNPWTNRPRGQEGAALAEPLGFSPPEKTAKTAFIWPLAGKKVLSEFGPKGKGKVNDGINIASGEGEPVWAAADGEVVYVGSELQGYGHMVLIKHAGNKTSTYAHLSRAAVEKYSRVKQGDIIGYAGSSGDVKQPQLHFAIRDGKEPVNPLKYLNRKMAAVN